MGGFDAYFAPPRLRSKKGSLNFGNNVNCDRIETESIGIPLKRERGLERSLMGTLTTSGYFSKR